MSGGGACVGHLAVCVSGVLIVVQHRDEEAGEEGRQGQQNCGHNKAGERQPDQGPVPVHGAVRAVEHPAQKRREAGQKSGR